MEKIERELIKLNQETSKIDAIALVKEYFNALTELYGRIINKVVLKLNHNTLVDIKSKLESLNLKHSRYYISKIRHDLKYNPAKLYYVTTCKFR